MTGGRANLKMTLIVLRDGYPGGNNCPWYFPYPGGCDDNHNGALDLAGGTALYLAGVQYAPSDNLVNCRFERRPGYAGQIWRGPSSTLARPH
jgi:hypothetical protein